MQSLRTQIVTWSFIPTAIILLAVALVAFYAYQRTTAALVLQQSEELTRLTASQFSTNFREYTDVLDGVTRSLSYTWYDPARCAPRCGHRPTGWSPSTPAWSRSTATVASSSRSPTVRI